MIVNRKVDRYVYIRWPKIYIRTQEQILYNVYRIVHLSWLQRFVDWNTKNIYVPLLEKPVFLWIVLKSFLDFFYSNISIRHLYVFEVRSVKCRSANIGNTNQNSQPTYHRKQDNHCYKEFDEWLNFKISILPSIVLILIIRLLGIKNTETCLGYGNIPFEDNLESCLPANSR